MLSAYYNKPYKSDMVIDYKYKTYIVVLLDGNIIYSGIK